MSIIYDSLLDDVNHTISYTAHAPDTNMYPASNFVTVLGPVWTPRIYAKDLTNLEVASSGSVAISLTDIHSMDFSMSTFDSSYMNTISSQSNYSLQLMTNSNVQMQFLMDATSNNITLNALSNMAFNVFNGNWTNFVSNNYFISVSNSFNATVNSNYGIGTISAPITFAANNSNTTFQLSNYDIFMYSSNNTNFSISNSLNTTVLKDVTESVGRNYNNVTQSNYSVATVSRPLSLSANSSNTTVTLGLVDVSVYSSNNTNFSISNNLTTTVAQSITETVGNTYNNVTQSNFSIATVVSPLSLTANSSNTSILLDLVDVSVYSSNNTNFSISNSLYTHVAESITETVGNTYNNVTQSNFSIATVVSPLSLSANSSNTTVTLGLVDVSVYSSNNTNFSISNNLTTHVAQKVTETVGDSFNNVTQSNFSVATVVSPLSLSANSSNTTVTLGLVDVSVYSSNNTNFSISNNLTTHVAQKVTETVGDSFNENGILGGVFLWRDQV